MKSVTRSSRLGWWALAAALLITTLVYAPGLHGTYLFDDYPNIVDNHGVQPTDASLPSLVRAALSSPSSEFKRPLASLSFAANYLVSGLDPYDMKVTNLVIHLLNGVLVFLLARELLLVYARSVRPASDAPLPLPDSTLRHAGIVAALISTGWLLSPINITAVLYIVQRMESLANLFVLLGLLGYVTGRRLMLGMDASQAAQKAKLSTAPSDKGLVLSIASVIICTAIGLMAKETAVMLPLYALLIEWTLLQFRQCNGRRDRRIITLFVVALAVPLSVGLAWLMPSLLQPATWSNRDFTLHTRLLSEARIVCSYILWILLPTPSALSFYHDNYRISQSFTSPWTTLASTVILCLLTISATFLRKRLPIVALGIFLFLGAQLLTATILPLELVYEHRNYFASFGLLLALVPLLVALPLTEPSSEGRCMALPRRVLLGGLLLIWSGMTAMTAQAWSDPLSLAQELAERAPSSPRAQYELGRTYIIYSNYVRTSPFTQLAYAPLERAAAMPESSILPQQALIFMNSRMHIPLKDAWWDSLIEKLRSRRPGVQDESSLSALVHCQHERKCDLPVDRMIQAFLAGLSHPNPSARLLATYGDYAWNTLDDKSLGLSMTQQAITASPNEAAYRITQIRMLIALGRYKEAALDYQRLEHMNIGGNLDQELQSLQRSILDAKQAAATSS